MKLNSFFNIGKIVKPKKSQEIEQKPKEFEGKVESYSEDEFYLTEAEKEFQDILKQQDKNKRNALIAGLLMLSSVAGISAYDSLNQNDQDFYFSRTEKVDENSKIACSPVDLAKGGKDDKTVELKELMQLLDFSGTESMPDYKRKSIEMVAMANLCPVSITDPKAREKIVTNIEQVQQWINHTVENWIRNPEKSYSERMQETMNKYVSGEELVRCVDFSELKKYQKDVTVLKGMLRMGMPKIERNDGQRSEKFAHEVESAQRLVDRITEQYRLKSYVEGNSDFDNTLSEDELRGVLNTESLHDLPDDIKTGIISRVVKGYKPLYFSINNFNDVEKTNKKILDTVQPIQNELDRLASDAQRENFMKSNPKEKS